MTKRPDEIALYNLILDHYSDRFSDGAMTFREMANEVGVHPKRAYRLAGKWTDKGWWTYGVSVMTGWPTPDGIKAMAEICERPVPDPPDAAWFIDALNKLVGQLDEPTDLSEFARECMEVGRSEPYAVAVRPSDDWSDRQLFVDLKFQLPSLAEAHRYLRNEVRRTVDLYGGASLLIDPKNAKIIVAHPTSRHPRTTVDFTQDGFDEFTKWPDADVVVEDMLNDALWYGSFPGDDAWGSLQQREDIMTDEEKPHPDAVRNTGDPIFCGYCEEPIHPGDWMVEKEDALAEPEFGDDPTFFVHPDCY